MPPPAGHKDAHKQLVLNTLVMPHLMYYSYKSGKSLLKSVSMFLSFFKVILITQLCKQII